MSTSKLYLPERGAPPELECASYLQVVPLSKVIPAPLRVALAHSTFWVAPVGARLQLAATKRVSPAVSAEENTQREEKMVISEASRVCHVRSLQTRVAVPRLLK